MERITSVEKPNVYQIAELYHQLILRVTPALMPSIRTRRPIDINNNPEILSEQIDMLDNVILYDEYRLYQYELTKSNKYKQINDVRPIARLLDITVYYDEAICMFIIVPFVSRFTRMRIKLHTPEGESVSKEKLQIIALDFCDQLRTAHAIIAERYVRDMAVYSIEHISDDPIDTVLLKAHCFYDMQNCVHSVYRYYEYFTINHFSKRILRRKWRSEMMLFNRALMVHYDIINELHPMYTKGLIDPIIHVYLENSDDVQISVNNGDTIIQSEWIRISHKNSIDSELGVFKFFWSLFVDRLNMNLLQTQFRINNMLSSTLPAQLLALYVHRTNNENDAGWFDNKVDGITKSLITGFKKTINERTIMRVNSFPTDDLPDMYDVSKYININSSDTNW